MSTATENVQTAIHTLDEDFAACAVAFEWATKRCAVSDAQRGRMAREFEAEPSSVSASKKLLNGQRVDMVKALDLLRREIGAYWKSNTLDYPDKGVRMIRISQLGEFDEKMRDYSARLASMATALQGNRQEVLDEAQDRLKGLFNEGDFPEDFSECFSVDWNYPSIQPPEYLRDLDPALYERELDRCRARLQEVVATAEEQFAERVTEIVGRLAAALTPGDDGNRRSLRKTTFDGLAGFFQEFDNLNVMGDSALATQVEQLRVVMQGRDQEGLKKADDAERESVVAQLNSVTENIDALLESSPRRRVVRPRRPAAPVEAEADQMEADLEADGVIDPVGHDPHGTIAQRLTPDDPAASVQMPEPGEDGHLTAPDNPDDEQPGEPTEPATLPMTTSTRPAPPEPVGAKPAPFNPF